VANSAELAPPVIETLFKVEEPEKSWSVLLVRVIGVDWSFPPMTVIVPLVAEREAPMTVLDINSNMPPAATSLPAVSCTLEPM